MLQSDCVAVVRFVHGLLRVSTVSPTRTCRIMGLARTIKTIEARFNGTVPTQEARTRRTLAMAELADIATHIGARLAVQGEAVNLVFAGTTTLTIPVVY